jgi:Lhr-like helicase
MENGCIFVPLRHVWLFLMIRKTVVSMLRRPENESQLPLWVVKQLHCSAKRDNQDVSGFPCSSTGMACYEQNKTV